MAQVAQALASGQVLECWYDLSPPRWGGIDADAGPRNAAFRGRMAPLPTLYMRGSGR